MLKARSSYFLMIIFLSVAGIALFYFFDDLEVQSQKISADNGEADYWAEGISGYQFSETGMKSYEMVADNLQHFINADRTDIKNPAITVFQNAKAIPWKITANTAKIFDETKRIEFFDDVHLQRLTTEEKEKLDAKTEWLVFYPRQDLVESDKLVIINSSMGETQGYGMKANIKEKQLELLSNVKGVYKMP